MIGPVAARIDQQQLGRWLVESARAEGVELVVREGLLTGLTKTGLTEIGSVQIEVSRDREGSFEPTIVRKRARRWDGIDEIVLSLSARGLTTGEAAAHTSRRSTGRRPPETPSRGSPRRSSKRWASGHPPAGPQGGFHWSLRILIERDSRAEYVPSKMPAAVRRRYFIE